MPLRDLELSKAQNLFDPRLARALSDHVRMDQRGLLVLPGHGPVFLGYLYALPLDNFSPPLEPHLMPDAAGFCADFGTDPDIRRLSEFLMFSPPAMRPLYMYMHAEYRRQAEDGQLPPGYAAALQAERMLWSRAEHRWVKRYLTPYIKKDRTHVTEHWLWTRASLSNKRVDVAWHGHWNVPVHRLLWPQFRPLEILYPDRRLVKNRICPDPEYKMCVNPHHYEYAVAYTDRSALPPGLQHTQRRSYQKFEYQWTVDNIETRVFDGIERDLVYCPEGHLMPPGVQDSLLLQRDPKSSKYNLSPHGRSVCARCKENAALQRGLDPDGSIKRQPRGMRQPSQIHEDQGFNDFEHGLLNSDWMRGLRNKPEQ